jgi:hypothetical protein
MNIQHEMFLVVDTLQSAGIDYALCGGLAVVVHGYPRLTQDIDVLIRELDLDPARAVLSSVGYSIESGMMSFEVGTVNEVRMFRVAKVEGPDYMTLDLVLDTPHLRAVWYNRERHQLQDRTLQVVSREGLATMKRMAGRPQDLADLSQLGLEPES